MLAHPFLGENFIRREMTNVRDIYLGMAETRVAEKDGKVVGFIALIGHEIGGLFVCPDHHGHGFGSLLVSQAYEEKGPLEVVVFRKNVTGRAFYAKYGFQEVARFFHEDSNQDCLRLTYRSA